MPAIQGGRRFIIRGQVPPEPAQDPVAPRRGSVSPSWSARVGALAVDDASPEHGEASGRLGSWPVPQGGLIRCVVVLGVLLRVVIVIGAGWIFPVAEDGFLE